MTELLDALGQPHVQLLLRLVLGGVLLLAGVTKLLDRESFRGAVAEYEVLPAGFERAFAGAVPVIEVTLGALLLVGLGTATAAALAAVLFLTFAFAIGVNLSRGRHFNCHCFGAVQSDPIGAGTLARALALAAVAIVVAVGASGFGSLGAALTGSTDDLPSASEIIPIVFIAFVIIDVLVLLPELLSFNRTMQRVRAGHHHGGRA
jgi:uncharacterized membrane protein YphA (DoxX/SURF4 family)